MGKPKMSKQASALIDLSHEVATFDGEIKPYADGTDRDLEVKIALTQPQFFNAGPYYEGAKDRIGMRMPDGTESIPGTDPRMQVPNYLSNTDHARKLVPAGWYTSSIQQDRWNPELWFVSLRKPGYNDASTAKTDSLAKSFASAALGAQALEIG